MPLEHSREDSPFWSRLFGALSAVESAVELALQASGTDANEKGVSAITKKKLAQRSVQSLAQSKVIINDLGNDLRELQRTTREWRNNMDFASKSQRELMEQAEALSMDLQTTIDQLHQTEAARLTASREAQTLISKLQEMEANKLAAEAFLKESQEKEERAHQDVISAREAMQELQQECDRAQQAAREKSLEAQQATDALESMRQEASRAATVSQRHQEVVAQLTADNLVLLMQLKKAEAELETTQAERNQLRMAVERQRGPWFAEVRAGVEAKVKEAMSRAEDLEQQIEALKQKHSLDFEVMSQEKAELEAFLELSRAEEARLSTLLTESQTIELRAREEAEANAEQAQQLQDKATALEAEVKALLASARSMREECNERWMNEQAATKNAAELGSLLANTRADFARLQAEARQLQSNLDSQVAVNKQLMARKEEVEWQLMAALAQVSGDEATPTAVAVSRSTPQVSLHPPHLSTQCPPKAASFSSTVPSSTPQTQHTISSIVPPPSTPAWHHQGPYLSTPHNSHPSDSPSDQQQPAPSSPAANTAPTLTTGTLHPPTTTASTVGNPAHHLLPCTHTETADPLTHTWTSQPIHTQIDSNKETNASSMLLQGSETHRTLLPLPLNTASTTLTAAKAGNASSAAASYPGTPERGMKVHVTAASTTTSTLTNSGRPYSAPTGDIAPSDPSFHTTSACIPQSNALLQVVPLQTSVELQGPSSTPCSTSQGSSSAWLVHKADCEGLKQQHEKNDGWKEEQPDELLPRRRSAVDVVVTAAPFPAR